MNETWRDFLETFQYLGSWKMNQQNQGLGSSSNVPIKRKRGRPRKEESVVHGENVPRMHKPDNVLNSNQTVGATDDCDDDMVGKVVTGVIEGTFNAGYLLNVKVADTNAFFRGLVFLPGQVNPVTAENDVAPHLKMIKRKEFPIPTLNPQTEIHVSVPSSVQCSKQSLEPELPVPMSEEQVLPTQIHSDILVSLENQSASALIPMVDLPKNDTSISSGGIPPGLSEPGHMNQSRDKTEIQVETIHELDASEVVKESSADRGVTKDSKPASESINLVATIENIDKELRIGQPAIPSLPQLNEVVHGEPNRSNIELNQIPVSTEPEFMPSEHARKSVGNFMEKQDLPKTDLPEDTNMKLAIEKFSKVDTSDSNGRTSTGTANILDVGSNQAVEAIQPESMPSEQIGHSVPPESKFSSEGCDFQDKNDPQNCSSLGDVDKADFNQAAESLVNSVEAGNQIGSDTY